jgi:hypothetical protein
MSTLLLERSASNAAKKVHGPSSRSFPLGERGHVALRVQKFHVVSSPSKANFSHEHLSQTIIFDSQPCA